MLDAHECQSWQECRTGYLNKIMESGTLCVDGDLGAQLLWGLLKELVGVGRLYLP